MATTYFYNCEEWDELSIDSQILHIVSWQGIDQEVLGERNSPGYFEVYSNI